MRLAPSSLLRRAAPMTFLVYVVLTLLSAVPVVPIALAFGPAFDRPGGSALLESLEESAPNIAAGTLAGFVVAGLALALSPLLQMAWLSAIARPMTVSEAIARGTQRYFHAVAVSVLMLVPLVVALLAAITAPLIAHLVLRDHPNDRMHDVIVVALLVPGIFLWLAWCAWHDLARAALLERARPLAAIRSAWRRLGPRAFGSYLAWTFLAASLALLGHVLGAYVDSGVLLIVLMQPLALARVACRAAWLGDAVSRVARAS